MRSPLLRTHRPLLLTITVSILATVAGACATGTRAPAAAALPQAANRSSATRIGRADIERQDVATLYDVLMRLRPEFLQTRNASPASPGGVMPLVYIDEKLLGDVSELRTIPRTMAREVRLLSAFDARERFGRVFPGGVIAVSTR